MTARNRTAPDWETLKKAWKPAAPPALDRAAILAAVHDAARRDAVDRTFSRAALAVPNWVCALAASLALAFATGAVFRAGPAADRQAETAWLETITPDEVAGNVLLTASLAPSTHAAPAAGKAFHE
jgi:hypothetical protein